MNVSAVNNAYLSDWEQWIPDLQPCDNHNCAVSCADVTFLFNPSSPENFATCQAFSIIQMPMAVLTMSSAQRMIHSIQILLELEYKPCPSIVITIWLT
jgi:hypothetical protein